MNELYVLNVQRDKCRQNDIMAQPKQGSATTLLVDLAYVNVVCSLFV